MTAEDSAPEGGESESISVITPAADAPTEFNSPSDAAKWLVSSRQNKPAAEAAEAPAEEEELSDEDNADPETAPREEPEAVKPDANPPIEPPRSWTQAEKERFQSLPRETQEYLSHREQERETALRRSQNEVAEQRKAAEAALKAAEEVRQKYESKLPVLEKKLQTAGPFADIQSMDDLRNLQKNDPFRFQEYQLYQWEQAAEQKELQEAESRKLQERQSKRNSYEAEQNKLLVEMVPEMADPNKAVTLRERAIAMLTDDLGLKNDQLSRWMQDDTGHEILSNAGIQKLIADGLKFRDIQNAPKAVVKPDLPPVQKPGTAKPVGNANSERIQALTDRLNQTGDLKIAQELRALQVQSRRRAS